MEINKNILTLPQGTSIPLSEEYQQTFLHGSDVRVERIISQGHRSPEGFWYDQEHDEWVVLLQGSAVLSTEEADGAKRLWRMRVGDSILLAAHQRHRVEATSIDPQAVWLAIHGDLRGVHSTEPK